MEGICEGFVICDDVEVAAFHKVVEVFDSQVNGQKLAVKVAELLLGGSQPPREVRKEAPRVVDQLLEASVKTGPLGGDVRC